MGTTSADVVVGELTQVFSRSCGKTSPKVPLVKERQPHGERHAQVEKCIGASSRHVRSGPDPWRNIVQDLMGCPWPHLKTDEERQGLSSIRTDATGRKAFNKK